MGAESKWVDRNAGPVVRRYALTGGRTQPVSEVLDLVAVVVAGRTGGEDPGLSPERRRIQGLCRSPATVADVASATGLPPGVVRVLHGLRSL